MFYPKPKVMKKYSFHIGIDVSKLKLDINLLHGQTLSSEHLVIENTPKAIKAFVKRLMRQDTDGSQLLFCCENTGVYSNHLIHTLTELGLDLWVVDALEIKRSKGISRGKSDKADAKDIAFYSLRNIDKLKLVTLTDLDIQKLKLLHGEREKAMKSLLLMESSKESSRFISKEVFKEISAINDSLVNAIKRAIKKIEDKIRTIIKSNQELSRQQTLIRSVPGVGEKTSVYFIIATKGFTTFENWRKFACYSGVAPFEYSSGSSIKGRTRVNHLADKKMKSLLQMCAMKSITIDAQMREYYDRKKLEGKNGMLALNNVRCKLISRVFAVVKRGTPYVDTYGFAS